MREGFNRYLLGGLLGMAVITLVILITRYIMVNALHKEFDTIFYWIGSTLFGILTWVIILILKKIDGKSDKKDLDSLKEVLTTKILSEEEAKHEILATMYSISGSIERMDIKFDNKLTALNQTLINHISEK